MKKHRVILIGLIVSLLLSACQTTNQSNDEHDEAQIKEYGPTLVFDYDVSAQLAAEDDYIASLSLFDYQSKFKSNVALDEAARRQVYQASISAYNDDEKTRITTAYHKVFKIIEDMSITLPDTIYIFSDDKVEGGAAYTRQNAICLPKQMIAQMTDDRLTWLVAHEAFHVISRYNQALRPDWYGIIGYRQTEPIKWPPELVDLTIANPDAPTYNYVICCLYQGKKMDFMPIIYADEPYDLSRDESFFRYLIEAYIAVDVVSGIPQPIYQDGQLLMVSKDLLSDFLDQVGQNTSYTTHPEETTADHFAMIILDNYHSAPNPEMVIALQKTLY